MEDNSIWVIKLKEATKKYYDLCLKKQWEDAYICSTLITNIAQRLEDVSKKQRDEGDTI